MVKRSYTLIPVDHFDRPLTFEIHHLRSYAAARAAALQLMAQERHYLRVEICSGSGQFIVERPVC